MSRTESTVLESANYTYRNYSEVKAELLWIESHYPAIAKVYDIGDSWEKTQSISDRDVLAIKISDNVQLDESEPEVLVTALHHAREWITTEVAVALVERLTSDYGTDERISWLVDNREIWIVPIVNPDGLDYSLAIDSMWRKNRRLNLDLTYGVDLNRNYGGSSNGDALGDWGGAGASTTPSRETYCGEAPFSEPETIAIRDLVLSKNFTLAVDMHSYGDLVLWPWGYTVNHTLAYDDLSRIGSELAASNGYVSEQSIMLYPTTGDSLDWMYGSAGIYAFCIEVGNEFHPSNATVVGESIVSNVAAAVDGIEIAGDREGKNITILHSPEPLRDFNSSGFQISATVTADRGVQADGVELVASLDGITWVRNRMERSGGNDTYVSYLPSVASGHVIMYYIVVLDSGGFSSSLPSYAPYRAFSITVAPPTPLSDVADFTIPSLVDGSQPWYFNATLVNSPYPTSLYLELTDDTTNESYPIPNVESRNYSRMFERGMRLGNYSAAVVATAWDYRLWSSQRFALEIADLTPPELSVQATIVAGNGTAERRALINITCSDFYGVSAVIVEYRIDGGQWKSVTKQSGDSKGLLGGQFSVALGKKSGTLEYRVQVNDARNTVSYPSDTGIATLTYPAVETNPIPAWVIVCAGVAAASAIVAAYLVIRARRP